MMSSGSSQNKNALHHQRRQHVRFSPDNNTLVWVQPLHPDGDADGQALVALPINESYKGCAVLMRAAPQLALGSKFLVTVGHLEPVLGTLVWIRQVEPGILRLGFALNVEPLAPPGAS